MKYLLLAFTGIVLIAVSPLHGKNKKKSADLLNNTLSPDEKNNGWELLFDGKSTDGWHTYGKDKVTGGWQIENGALHLIPSPNAGDLTTNKEYSNFDLKLEWKISPKGNSGVLFFVKDDPKYDYPFYSGPEMQVLDNDGHEDGKIIKHRAGDLYDLISCSKETVKPVGEWNKVEIIAKDGDLKLFLNGFNVVHTTMWDDHWKQMVAGSKFKQWPEFSTFKTGSIDLQNHGNEVWFRNIKIKTL